MTDTIVAVSSGAGRAGVAVLRVSGPAVTAVAAALCGGRPAPRRAALRWITGPDGERLDRALVLSFPAPHSFTGEDVLELHVHGGPAVVRDVLAAVVAAGPCRPAEPGEFTRRAFMAGQMDLSEVEGLADLIAAETTEQRRFALREAAGATRTRVEGWRTRLVQAMALLEAMIDFADEEDAPDDTRAEVRAITAALQSEITAHLAAGPGAERLRDGVLVVVTGPPNAGKSSLVNALVGRPVAIVSAVAGTTRDAIEVRLDLEGVPVLLVDTAGLRALAQADAIEVEGMRRARSAARDADLVLELEAADARFDSQTERPGGTDVLRVWSKSDLAPAPAGFDLGVSRDDPETVAHLRRRLAELARDAIGGAERPLVARERHRFALETTVGALGSAVAGLDRSVPVEIVADHLRAAAHALARIGGRVDVEDLLDVIFREFCIGK